MNAPTPIKRPKRLWVAAILDALIAILAMTLVAFLLTSSRVPAAVVPSAIGAISALIPAAFLLLYAALAVKGVPSARRGLLLIASVYFGSIVVQNAVLLWGPAETLIPSRKLLANVVRHSISLGINWWALSSLKTRLFFEAQVLLSNKSPDSTRES